jgi:hypothetical protein
MIYLPSTTDDNPDKNGSSPAKNIVVYFSFIGCHESSKETIAIGIKP